MIFIIVVLDHEKFSSENSGGNINEAEFTYNDCKKRPSKLRKNNVGRH